jgi:cytochrome c oxidase cbb3-type subunit III
MKSQNKYTPDPDPDPEYNDGPFMDVEDHEYDGIKELNNPPPGWIMAVFYVTIGISILYGAYYFWLRVGDKQDAEYAKSVEIASVKYNRGQAGGPMKQLTDQTSLDAGKATFTAMNCITCHGPGGGGNAIGPNLTDDYWIHGCKFEEVFSSIQNGYPTKGMTPFNTQLSDKQIQEVASYVMSLRGSGPTGPKAPQGDLCK